MQREMSEMDEHAALLLNQLGSIQSALGNSSEQQFKDADKAVIESKQEFERNQNRLEESKQLIQHAQVVVRCSHSLQSTLTVLQMTRLEGEMANEEALQAFTSDVVRVFWCSSLTAQSRTAAEDGFQGPEESCWLSYALGSCGECTIQKNVLKQPGLVSDYEDDMTDNLSSVDFAFATSRSANEISFLTSARSEGSSNEVDLHMNTSSCHMQYRIKTRRDSIDSTAIWSFSIACTSASACSEAFGFVELRSASSWTSGSDRHQSKGLRTALTFFKFASVFFLILSTESGLRDEWRMKRSLKWT